MSKVKARGPNGEKRVCDYTPLTDPATALIYADKLRDSFNEVIVHVREEHITVTARNVHKV